MFVAARTAAAGWWPSQAKIIRRAVYNAQDILPGISPPLAIGRVASVVTLVAVDMTLDAYSTEDVSAM